MAGCRARCRLWPEGALEPAHIVVYLRSAGRISPHKPPAISLPAPPHVQLRDGELRFNGLELEALARAVGTPLDVYSQQLMLDAVAA